MRKLYTASIYKENNMKKKKKSGWWEKERKCLYCNKIVVVGESDYGTKEYPKCWTCALKSRLS